MDTSQGESSQDIRSLNQINFSFIVLGYSYFMVMNKSSLFLNFAGLARRSSIKIRHPRFSHVF